MKKLLLFLIFSFFICCTKENQLESEVNFSIDLCNEIITKSNNTIIETLIKETLPDHYNLKLTNLKNNYSYQLKSTESIIIPNGNYLIENTIGHERENCGFQKLYGRDCDPSYSVCVIPNIGITKFPQIYIRDTIIINGSTNYKIKAKLNCQAFIYNSNNIDYIEWEYRGATMKVECINRKDSLCLFYNRTYYQNSEPGRTIFNFTCYPVYGKNYEITKFSLQTRPEHNGLLFGKYYELYCREVENSNINSIIEVPSFEKGELISPYDG